MSAVRWQDVPVPERMARRPVDKIGRPVPWFVAWINSEPDFRIIGPEKIREALQFELCWLCGQPLGRFLAFLVGPMCVVNRTTAEPPSHASCAEYAARVCPFLTRPLMQRRETSMPEGVRNPAGEMIRRNPGVSVVWITRRFDIWFPRKGEAPLIRMGDPDDVFWFAEARRAYRGEIVESLASGLPLLRESAMAEGDTAVAMLDLQVRRAQEFIPSDDAPLGAQEVVR